MQRLRDAYLARALAMIVIGERGRYDLSQRRLEADCGDGVLVTLDRLKRDWLVVQAGFEVVLAVDWHPFDSASDIKHNVSAFSPGTWEDALYRIAKPRLRWADRRYWRRRQRRRQWEKPTS
jgi:hypothetical protein